MSHFYGTLQGSRGEATRCGTKSSGLTVRAASWAGAITVNIVHNHDTDKDHFYVTQTPWHGRGTHQVLAEGVIGEQMVKNYGATPEASCEK